MDPGLKSRILLATAFAVRLALLLTLTAAAVVTSAPALPSPGTLDRFKAALAADQVDRVAVRLTDDGGLSSLVWSESPLIWHEIPWSEDGRTFTDARGRYDNDRLLTDLRRAKRLPSWRQERGLEQQLTILWILPRWPFAFRGGDPLIWTAIAWVAAFLLMLYTTSRLANTWAWFWFCTIGQFGVLLFLLLEPRPMWRGPGPGRPVAERMTGGRGCVWSVALGIVSLWAAYGLGGLVRLVLG